MKTKEEKFIESKGIRIPVFWVIGNKEIHLSDLLKEYAEQEIKWYKDRYDILLNKIDSLPQPPKEESK